MQRKDQLKVTLLLPFETNPASPPTAATVCQRREGDTDISKQREGIGLMTGKKS